MMTLLEEFLIAEITRCNREVRQCEKEIRQLRKKLTKVRKRPHVTTSTKAENLTAALKKP